MKTLYEQIQYAIEHIEKRLFTKLSYAEVARSVYMSSRSFYDYFWAITGYTYKEYVMKRRLNEAMKRLLGSNEKILNIALDIGYESHEAFTRAFKKELGVSPLRFRESGLYVIGLEKITLYKEINMGIIVRELPEITVVCFEAYHPNAEIKASEKRDAWIAKKKMKKRPYRVFGHNIMSDGKMAAGHECDGYRFMVSIDDPTRLSAEDKKDTIAPGRFLVTGIEGNIDTDPEGQWIMAGWRKMNDMVEKKKYRIKEGARWFEEELEPVKPGDLRLDLYLEIE